MALLLCSPQRPFGNSLKSAGLGHLESHPRLELYTRQPEAWSVSQLPTLKPTRVDHKADSRAETP